MSDTKEIVLRVAVFAPLRRLFDYLPPETLPADQSLQPGLRVKIRFGRSQRVGVIISIETSSELPNSKLKPVDAILDRSPLFAPSLFKLIQWAIHYYHSPPGEVYSSALPVYLREARESADNPPTLWRLTSAAPDDITALKKRAPKQAQLLEFLHHYPNGLSAPHIRAEIKNCSALLRDLLSKGWITEETRERSIPLPPVRPSYPLSEEQKIAVHAVSESLGKFQTFLLQGITGSGKTEVYQQLVAKILERNEQVLILVPEIGLTPQLLAHFRNRFSREMATLHSSLSKGERLQQWYNIQNDRADIIIGTRSAIFAPIPRLGLIIIDEEHDASFKQQDGFRYSARDVGIKRAQLEQCPILLGSATPSLESLFKARQGSYSHLQMVNRVGEAIPPTIELIDTLQLPLQQGLSQPLLQAMHLHLDRGAQVLLFINRRGYAPTLYCFDCRWIARCSHCDAHVTLHSHQQQLQCHHCGLVFPRIYQCPQCSGRNISPLGEGTERIEETVAQLFSDTEVIRIDRDSTQRKGSFEKLLQRIEGGERQILIGTQMLAKGHHFPKVTLVGILNIDQGLFSADFRATERMAQLVLQVSGRAGREKRPGTVIIQTVEPRHPLLQELRRDDYSGFASRTLNERSEALMPPFSYLALIRAESRDQHKALQFLELAAEKAFVWSIAGVDILGPVPAPMERKAGRYRMQLLLQSQQRRNLHQLLNLLIAELESSKLGRQLRWSVDIDPMDMN